MLLSELFQGLKYQILQGGQVTEITSLSFDSRDCQPGCLFICEKGAHFDGSRFLPQVKEKGAVAAVTATIPEVLPEGMTVLLTEDLTDMKVTLVRRFYEAAFDSLRAVGLTGTNGKTTTSTLIHHILQCAGEKSGLIGTNQILIGDSSRAASFSTPPSVTLGALFEEMYQNQVSTVVMEVSSHALEQKRAGMIRFALGIFTNLTEDHLDYHQTMENYYLAKQKLFLQCETGLINADDDAGRRLLREGGCPMVAYGLGPEADFRAEAVAMDEKGLSFDWFFKEACLGRVRYPVPGLFNVYNSLAAVSACYLLGVTPEQILSAIDVERPLVSGRFEVFHSHDGVSVVVDYAHTPDGLQKVLETAREFTKGRLILVFGCGGDRDPIKRPIMGEIGGQLADFCFVTSDNPRTEDPLVIIRQVEAGVKPTGTPYEIEPDRRKAIRSAVLQARSGDVVMIAGKGHEDYQIIGTTKIHLDDREEVAKALSERK